VAHKDVLKIRVPTAFTSHSTLRLDNHGYFALNDDFGLYLAAIYVDDADICVEKPMV
jgi:hypothetical protein